MAITTMLRPETSQLPVLDTEEIPESEKRAEAAICAAPSEIDLHVNQFLLLHNPELLDTIIEENMGYVRAVVLRVANAAPSVVDVEDLLQCGILGLLSSVYRYDSSLGIPFRSWAYRRIRGSAIDAIRKASNTSRTRNVQFVTLNDVYAEQDSSVVLESGLSPKASRAVREAVKALPLRQATVVLLSLNQVPVVKIAMITGTSTSQVQQDKRMAMSVLRDQLLEFMSEIV